MKKLPLSVCLRSATALAILCSGTSMAAPTETRVHIRTMVEADTTPWLTAFRGGGGGVALDRAWKRAWETFTVVDLNGGTLDFGDLVGIRSVKGQYLSVDVVNGGAVFANRERLGEWETFRLGATVPRAFDGTPIGALDAAPVPADIFQLVAYDGQALTTADSRSVYALAVPGLRDDVSYFQYETAD